MYRLRLFLMRLQDLFLQAAVAAILVFFTTAFAGLAQPAAIAGAATLVFVLLALGGAGEQF